MVETIYKPLYFHEVKIRDSCHACSHLSLVLLSIHKFRFVDSPNKIQLNISEHLSLSILTLCFPIQIIKLLRTDL
ncbi:hypothetical protein J608_2057, partial [Acinetobacter baumannii 1288284]